MNSDWTKEENKHGLELGGIRRFGSKQPIADIQKSEIIKRRAGKKRMAKLRTLPEKNINPALENASIRFDLTKDYNVGDKLGQGTYASVFLAIHKDTKEPVAVKTSRGSTARGYLQKEYNIMSELDDPIIPKVKDFKEDNLLK